MRGWGLGVRGWGRIEGPHLRPLSRRAGEGPGEGTQLVGVAGPGIIVLPVAGLCSKVTRVAVQVA